MGVCVLFVRLNGAGRQRKCAACLCAIDSKQVLNAHLILAETTAGRIYSHRSQREHELDIMKYKEACGALVVE